MIEQADWLLVGGLVAFAVLITFAASSFYYVQRVWDLRIEHVEELRQRNHEIIQARASVREVRMKAQVLDAIPVSRLIGTGKEEQ